MASKENRLPMNSIVKAIRAANGDGAHTVYGFVGETKDGQVTIYQDLDLNIRMILPLKNVLHVESPDEDTKPSAIYVNSDSKVTLQRSVSFSDLIDGPEGLGGQWIAVAPQAGPHAQCRRRCNEVFTDLGDNVACLDFCNCRHRDGFSFNKCSREFHDATNGKFKR